MKKHCHHNKRTHWSISTNSPGGKELLNSKQLMSIHYYLCHINTLIMIQYIDIVQCTLMRKRNYEYISKFSGVKLYNSSRKLFVGCTAVHGATLQLTYIQKKTRDKIKSTLVVNTIDVTHAWPSSKQIKMVKLHISISTKRYAYCGDVVQIKTFTVSYRTYCNCCDNVTITFLNCT